MLFGSHISASGGVEKAPERAAAVGCEVFQFFSRPPQGGLAPKLTPAQIKEFKENCKKFKQADSYIHAPYYINLASLNNRIRYGSISVIREELERGSLLGCKYVMTHLGSARDVGEKKGVVMAAEGIKKILTGYKGVTQFLIEISAGAGAIIGDTFEEIAEIIERVEKTKGLKNKIGVCFDTCHAFASGYDLRNNMAVKKTFDKFNRLIGLERLKMSHCNDSMFGLGEHKDRHEHLGKGQIGLKGFESMVNHPKLRKVNFILETPKDNPQDDVRNLNILKKFRGK
ncbi:MAG: deoxyribonuclease IV [Patescibacteria group bacterium]